MPAFIAHISLYRHPEKYDFNNSFFWDPPGCNTSAVWAYDVFFIVVLKNRKGHGISTNT